jgi:uncharacterized SAM-binding protein YcdF (DUF218 family)
MFFILSKVLSSLIQPIVIVFLILLASVLVKGKRWRRTLAIAGVALLFFFSNAFIANEVMRLWELPGTPFTEMKPYDVAIVLTGVAVHKSLGPSDRTHYYLGADRVIHTAQLYKLGLIKKVIISGGVGRIMAEGEPEAWQLKKSLVVMGVPDSVLYIDPSSDNTYENAVESKKIVKTLGIDVQDCLLVTSAFHMRRALACFKKADMSIDYFTCDFRATERSFTPDVLLVPKLDAVLIWQKLLKEWAGFVAYKVAGYI